ncbi:hypothetical protein GCM10025786_34960 [Nocardioides caeni]
MPPTVFWHMWKIRQWPYSHINNGDFCYLVSSGGAEAEIFAELVIDRVVRLKYFGHAAAWDGVKGVLDGAHFSGLSRKKFLSHPETVDRPVVGYLLAFVGYPLSPKPLGMTRPDWLRIQQQGWAQYDLLR